MGGRHLGASRYVYLAACKPLAKLGAGAGGVHAQALQQAATTAGADARIDYDRCTRDGCNETNRCSTDNRAGLSLPQDALSATNTTQRCTPASSHSSRPSTA